ncbi:MAG: FAD:protein FMN transferase [Dysgonamonadaceae bacterium]|jgi:thiamine biosynthesis lipoprotein|nr:FAD:protein FMN transferase [Dysgonamonadaceae bacterium]
MKKWILFLSACSLGVSCGQQTPYYEESGTVFHTYYRIKYQSKQLLTDQIDAEFQAFNLSLNPFNPNSILAKVNRNEDVEVDEWFATVFNRAMDVSARSDGMFDVTTAPLINLWGFGFEQQDSVSQQIVDSLLTFVGYRKIRMKNNRVVKDDPRMMLNFSAIAKGFACDVIAGLLEREGIVNYMVDIGGEVAVNGLNPNGLCWRVGISTPEDDRNGTNTQMNGIVQLCDRCGMATSGNYRNFYEKDGKRYAHTIDPRTGYPSEQSILSATVIASDCMTADAYATACMATGLEKAVQMMEALPGMEYYFIYSTPDNPFQVKYSEGLSTILLK